MKIIPTPKITYKKEIPNPDHVFPTDLTAKYCSEGKHPDTPGFQINQTEHIAECIDYLTGNEVGTYAASLQFGSGSSFSPDEYGVATYHMINSANKLFNYWDSHHQGFHDALEELSIKMTPENLKELIPPPPPPPKKPLLKIILISVAVGVALIALPTVGYFLGAAMFSEVVATTSEIASEIGAAEDVLATSAEGSAESIAAEGFVEEAAADPANVEAFNVYEGAEEIAEEGGAGEASCPLEDCPAASIFRMASYFDRIGGEDFLDYFVDESELRKRNKRDTVPMKFGFYTANMMNSYFLPSLMNNVHQSFTGSGQTYPDISSYLSAASEHLQFHFEDTLHNNFFAGNKSILASFTVNTIAKKNKRLDNIYNSIKNSTYNTMAATIISATLRKFNVEICDTKPSFCGEPCGNSGHIYCPIVGNDTNSCVITATDNQVKELKYLREPFDICSKANGTGWNLTHNSNCDRNQFQCK